MSAENNSDKTETKGRGRSMTGFPYVDLENGVETARGVITNGTNSCSFQQLADTVGNALDSNAFRIRVNTTWRQYGLIAVNKDQISLTDLGHSILAPETEQQAKIEAFFRVPLYKDLFAKFSNQALPSSKEVERVMEDLGVAPLQKARARQIFMRSAKQAGLFDNSAVELSIPNGIEIDMPVPTRELAAPEQSSTVSTTTKRHVYDPAIEGLLKKLPQAETEWPYAERIKWLRALSVALDLIYLAPSDDENAVIEVTKKVS